MLIKGLQKNTLVDYPGKVAATIFLAKCNYRCPFCQNPDLVDNYDSTPTISEDDVFSFLRQRSKWLDGVCITGGEPTLWRELPEFIENIKSHKLLVKLDTNGSNPRMLKELIDRKLLDYVAMDIKSGKGNYDKATGVKTDLKAVQQSIDILKNSNIDYEFRTTAVPGLFDEKTAKDISAWLKGSRFALQSFRPKNTLDKSFQDKKPFSKEEMERFTGMMKKEMDVELRY